MNTEKSMIQRIEALPDARKNAILTAIWLKTLTSGTGAVYITDIETLVEASEQVETEVAKGESREDFYEQEQRDDEADNMLKLPGDTVLVEGIGTMLRGQASIQTCYCKDDSLRKAYEKAANGPAYKEAK